MQHLQNVTLHRILTHLAKAPPNDNTDLCRQSVSISLLAGYKLVSTLGSQQQRRSTDASSEKKHHAPTNRTHDPRFVKSPSGKEAVVVIVEVSLQESHTLAICIVVPGSPSWNLDFRAQLHLP